MISCKLDTEHLIMHLHPVAKSIEASQAFPLPNGLRVVIIIFAGAFSRVENKHPPSRSGSFQFSLPKSHAQRSCSPEMFSQYVLPFRLPCLQSKVHILPLCSVHRAVGLILIEYLTCHLKIMFFQGTMALRERATFYSSRVSPELTTQPLANGLHPCV